jgi:preprotein translocase subunit SecF
MKKLIWIVFFTALVVVNLLAMAAEYFGGVYIAIPYRLVIVLAISMISSIFIGAWVLLKTAEKEEPRH